MTPMSNVKKVVFLENTKKQLSAAEYEQFLSKLITAADRFEFAPCAVDCTIQQVDEWGLFEMLPGCSKTKEIFLDYDVHPEYESMSSSDLETFLSVNEDLKPLVQGKIVVDVMEHKDGFVVYAFDEDFYNSAMKQRAKSEEENQGALSDCEPSDKIPQSKCWNSNF